MEAQINRLEAIEKIEKIQKNALKGSRRIKEQTISDEQCKH